MSFGSPWLLGLLAFLPLLALLHFRRRPRILRRVPWLALWRAPGPAGPPRPRLLPRRSDVATALELALIACLIVALARPMSSDPGSRRLVLVLDTSASMAAMGPDGSRFDRARRRALELVDALPPGGRARLVVASSRLVMGEPAAPAELRRSLENLEVEHLETDLADVLANALALATADERVVLLSDGAGRELPDDALLDPRLEVISFGDAAGNVAITGIAPRTDRSSPFDGELLVEVANYSARARSLPLSVHSAGGEAARAVVELAPGERRSHVFTGLPTGGLLEARLAAPRGDALGVDDNAWAWLERRRRSVLLVSDRARYLEPALAADPRIELYRMPPRDYAAGAGALFDVVVFQGPAPAATPGERRLLFPLPAGTARDGAPIAVSASARRHPLTGWAGAAGLALAAGVPGAGAPRRPGEEVLLTAGGRPVVTAWEQEGEREVRVALDAEDPRWATGVTFPLLVVHAVSWLTGDAIEGRQAKTGEPLRWRIPPGADPADFVVRRPDGRPATPRADGAYLHFADTGRVGVYTLVGPDLEEPAAVNLASPSESDLAARTTIPAPGTRGAGGLAGDPPGGHTRPVGHLFLLAALGLLGALALLKVPA